MTLANLPATDSVGQSPPSSTRLGFGLYMYRLSPGINPARAQRCHPVSLDIGPLGGSRFFATGPRPAAPHFLR